MRLEFGGMGNRARPPVTGTGINEAVTNMCQEGSYKSLDWDPNNLPRAVFSYGPPNATCPERQRQRVKQM